MPDQKISDEELEQEIRDNKTQKEIAYKYGLGYPSKQLSERARRLGFRFNSKFSIQTWGGASFSIDSGTIQKAQELSGIKPFSEDGRDKLYKSNTVVENPESFDLREGDIVMRLQEKPWRKKE